MRTDFGKALAALVPRLRSYAKTLTRGTTIEADDLVHDALVEALSSQKNFDGDNLQAWAFQIQRRKFYRLVRAAVTIPQKQDPRALEEDSLSDSMIAQPSQIDAAYLAEVKHAIASLPTDKREVLHLTAVGGLDQREVATVLGITEAAVKMRVFQARRAISEILESPRNQRGAVRAKGSLTGGRRGGRIGLAATPVPALGAAAGSLGARAFDLIELATAALI